MHETALARSIADLVLASATEAGLGRVTRIVLDIGRAAPVDPEAIRFVLPLFLEETSAAGANISIERTALLMRCRSCGADHAPSAGESRCPSCGGVGGDIMAGREMRVVAIEGA